MKEKKIFRKLLILLTVAITATVFGMGSVCAVTTAPTEETYAVESFVEETQAQTSETTEPAEEVTDPTEGSTSADATEEAAKPEPTYREPLPELEEDDIVVPSAIVENIDENEPALFWGFVAWICIGVGAAVIFAVLLTTKTKAYRGGGRKRYSTGDKISGKKRLLSDEYYNKRKR